MLLFLLLNVVLFLSCYLAGCIPIFFSLPAAKLRIITVFGAGLLLGAALVVIIPEGVGALYANAKDCYVGVHDISVGDFAAPIKPKAVVVKQNAPLDQSIVAAIPAPGALERSESASDPHVTFGVHQQIGTALLLGYMFMLLVDQLSAPVLQSYYCTNGLHRLIGGCCPRQLAGALGSTVQINSVSSNEAGTASDGTAERVAPGHGRMRSTATVGLVFHSFADGLALGVAFALNQIQLEMIMFVAIILHKLPAAFGLACYLVHEGFTRAQIRVHLLVFASASPLAALISYAYFVLPVGSSSSNKSDAVATKTGFALLLSGGTFLYVAASHILPELLHTTVNQQTCRPQPAQSNLSLSWHSQVNCEPSKAEDYTLYTVDAPENHVVFTIPSKQFTETGRLRPMELLVLCVGAVLPIFVSASHSH